MPILQQSPHHTSSRSISEAGSVLPHVPYVASCSRSEAISERGTRQQSFSIGCGDLRTTLINSLHPRAFLETLAVQSKLRWEYLIPDSSSPPRSPSSQEGWIRILMSTLAPLCHLDAYRRHRTHPSSPRLCPSAPAPPKNVGAIACGWRRWRGGRLRVGGGRTSSLRSMEFFEGSK